jgi:hypothetical protein
MSNKKDPSKPKRQSTGKQAIERIILARPRSDVTQEQLDAVIDLGRELITAIPGVEQMSFGIATVQDASHPFFVRIRFRDRQALQVYETHPNPTTFGAVHWLPVIADQTVTDYLIQY